LPRFTQTKNRFLAGELTPRLKGAVDLPIYQQGCEKQKNMLTLPLGGVTRRPGTQYIMNAVGAGRLIPFSFSKKESYVVEFTNNALRVIDVSTGNTYTVTLMGSAAAYPANALESLRYAQSGDLLYLVLGPSVYYPQGLPPQILARTSVSPTFELRDWLYNIPAGLQVLAYPYRDLNTGPNPIVPSATTGNITLTTFVPFFTPTQIGSIFKLTDKTTAITGAVVITSLDAVTPLTKANATVLNTLGAASSTVLWEESAWSNFRGWPKAITFFESRLCLAGNLYQPDTLWCSRSGNYQTFMQRKFAQDLTVVDAAHDTSKLNYFGALIASDACSYTLASLQLNQIQWLCSSTTLAVGTLGAEYTLDGIDATAVPSCVPSETRTTGPTVPVRMGNSVVYLDRAGRNVFELAYDFRTTSYISTSISQQADHMVDSYAFSHQGLPSTIAELQVHPSLNVLWARSDAGGLLALTRDPQNQVVAWHDHPLGGDGQVLSMCVIPYPKGDYDCLVLEVRRPDTGAITLEMIGREYLFPSLQQIHPIAGNLAINQDAPFFSDCAVYATNTAPHTVSGLNHLANREVAILADGLVHPNKTVSAGGVLTLDWDATEIIVGLPYTPIVKILPIEAGSVLGSSQGAIKRVDRATIRFDRTIGCKYGPSEDKLKSLDFRNKNVPMNAITPMFSGNKQVDFPMGYELDACVVIVQDQPLPMTILSITTRGDTNEV
jgi:hypothetical protein